MSENRLKNETSPYLLQHKDNPVHWWAWGPEALAEAKKTGKPILLSVGYAACHWCHVMAHESFEDDETAAVMNELFVNIKVDREERPDIDAIYMSALHRLGEQGGWPLTMFLDTKARPFWGGTYFPKQARFGRPAFQDVLRGIEKSFREETAKVSANAEIITSMLARKEEHEGIPSGFKITDDLLRELTNRMVRAIDPDHGGIQGAPKFPQWSFFWLLWRGGIRFENSEAIKSVEKTLVHICQGGIYDHLGGGFARYSVDERWLVPHFEKMLYDNALLIDLMTEAWRETGNALFKVRIEETVDWLQREMIANGGGFAASLDADSEGEEGLFYVWNLAQITDILGPDDTRFFANAYDVSAGGNWEGKTILNRLESRDFLGEREEQRLAQMRGKLLAARDKRIRPGWDDKVLADWNGLMIASLSRAAIVFDKPAWLDLAKTAFAFVTGKLSCNGRLLHSYRAGTAKAPATASDYANMIWAALRLHQATTDATFLEHAENWAGILDRHYWVEERNAYATSADDTDDVIVRMVSGSDDATPNANAILVPNLMHLSLLTGDAVYHERAEAILQGFAGDIAKNLVAHTGLIVGSIDVDHPMQIAIAGHDKDGGGELCNVMHDLSLPNALEYAIAGDVMNLDAPALAGKTAEGGKATAYVCIGPQCSPPINDASTLREMLQEKRTAGSA